MKLPADTAELANDYLSKIDTFKSLKSKSHVIVQNFTGEIINQFNDYK